METVLIFMHQIVININKLKGASMSAIITGLITNMLWIHNKSTIQQVKYINVYICDFELNVFLNVIYRLKMF